MHERIHLRRFDHVTRAIAFLALCIHWFNPLVWLAFFLYGRDMEMSCDEAVIKHLGSDAKKNYSTLLLALATGRKSLSGIPLAFGEGDTKGRIRNVLGFKRPAVWLTLTVLIVVVGLSVGLMANPLEPPVPDAPTNKVENMPEIPAKKLWQPRTPHIGNNSAVGNIIINPFRHLLHIVPDHQGLPRDVAYDFRYLNRGFSGFFRQLSDFSRHNGKTPSCFSCTGCFNCRI